MNNYLKRKTETSPFNETWYKDFFQIPSFLNRENYLKTDILETENEYNLIIDAPGIKKEDVKIYNEEGYLTIEVNHSCSLHSSNNNYLKKERMHESYSRSYYIGNGVNSDEINATFHDGILEISFPKTKKETNNKYIPIK